MIYKKTLPKSTCPPGSFTYPQPSGSGVCRALLDKYHPTLHTQLWHNRHRMRTLVKLNSLPPGRCKKSTFNEISLRRMPVNTFHDQSTLAQAMAWCQQATSQYLNQCWPRSQIPYGVTRPQWLKIINRCTQTYGSEATSVPVATSSHEHDDDSFEFSCVLMLIWTATTPIYQG